MVELVEADAGVAQTIVATTTAPDTITSQRQIDATDARIDRLVYELYGLTEDEIKIVEEALK